tara:strand:- start:1131 stop:1844 length:714 start_codon:yes stop_codon:yes gene_type:complete
MKDLSTLINNYKPIATTAQHVAIDEFAKSIINKVFDQLSKIFPAWQYNWKTQKEIDGAKMEWTKAFSENNICTMEQIKFGFAKARSSESDFLPSCGKFISWCTPTAEDLGYPSETQAMEDCIKYRNNQKMFTPLKFYTRPIIIELCKRVDWWSLNNATNKADIKKSEAKFNQKYIELINSGYDESINTSNERLETNTVIKDRMSPQQLEDGRQRGLDVMREVRKKLKTTNKLNKVNE